jgi:hypothetical protein
MNKNKNMTALEFLSQFISNENEILKKTIIDQAKAMEKEQIMDAFDIGFEEGCKFPEDIKLNNAEQYYKETYEH